LLLALSYIGHDDFASITCNSYQLSFQFSNMPLSGLLIEIKQSQTSIFKHWMIDYNLCHKSLHMHSAIRFAHFAMLILRIYPILVISWSNTCIIHTSSEGRCTCICKLAKTQFIHRSRLSKVRARTGQADAHRNADRSDRKKYHPHSHLDRNTTLL